MIDPYKIINKYYHEGSEIHFVLVKHSEDVTAKALDVARNHPELQLDTEFIAQAAMLHDIGIFMCDAHVFIAMACINTFNMVI